MIWILFALFAIVESFCVVMFSYAFFDGGCRYVLFQLALLMGNGILMVNLRPFWRKDLISYLIVLPLVLFGLMMIFYQIQGVGLCCKK